MPTNVVLRQRRPFTAKKALAYLMILVGLSATIALPVVVILASRDLSETKSQLNLKEKEIQRLKSESLIAGPQDENLHEKSDTTAAGKLARGKNLDRFSVSTSFQGEEEATRISNVASDISSADFETRLDWLYNRVVGTEKQIEQPQAEDFESRLARLHERVVQHTTEK